MRTRLLFYDDDHREWLVQDGNVHRGEFQLLPLGTPLADFRVFDLTVPRERRIYSFHRDQHHAIDEALLERQFVEAKLVTTCRAASADSLDTGLGTHRNGETE